MPFLTILTSKSLSRAGVVQILSTSWAADPSHHLAFRTYLCEPSKRQNHGKTQHFVQFLPAKISHVSHLRCKTSLLSHIDAARLTGNFQYSRKLELLNFLWPILTHLDGIFFDIHSGIPSHQKLAVEVRQGTMRPGACSGGPLRSGQEERRRRRRRRRGEMEEEEEKEEEETECSYKISNPHLIGGE